LRFANIGVITLLMTVMFSYSALVALRQNVWSPLDEGGHWYVANNLVLHARYPRIDEAPRFPTSLPTWAAQTNIEAVQPPLAYAVAGFAEAAAGWVAPALGRVEGHPLDPDWLGLRAMRLTNSIELALLVLLLWLAARIIAPGNLALMWGLPAASYMFRGPIVDATRVGNDVLAGLLTTLAIILAIRWRVSLRPHQGVVLGASIGLATLARETAVYAFVPVGLILLMGLVGRGRGALGRSIQFLAMTVVTWVALVLPWLAFIHHRYGNPTGAPQMKAVLPAAFLLNNPVEQIQVAPMTNPSILLIGEWGSPVRLGSASFNTVVELAAVALAAAGIVALLLAREEDGLSRLERIAMLVSAPAMLLLLVALSITSGIDLMLPGRYDLPAALPIALVLAAGPCLLLPRRFHVAVGLLMVLGAMGIAAHDMVLAAGPWPPGV
jgi:hypothetical protein